MPGSPAAPPGAGYDGYAENSYAEIGGCQLIQRLDANTGPCARAVYLARQQRLGNRLVVVTLTHLDAGAEGEEQAGELRTRLLRHARALGQFTHPNVLPLYDAGIAHGSFYLVTQYVPDGSLAAALEGTAPRGRLALPARPRFVAALTVQVAAALQYLHALGMVHGAVGPASVLLHAQPDGRWRALLADAGPPDLATDASTLAPPASAPTAADDQAALAALAYLLLTGQVPAAIAATEEAPLEPADPAADHAAALRAANPAVPAAAAHAISRALAPDPTARFAAVGDFAQAFAGGFDPAWLPAAREAWEAPPAASTAAAPPLPPSTAVPLPPEQWLAPDHARPAPRGVRVGQHAGAGPAARRTWRRGTLGIAGVVVVLAALVLALRLPDSGAGLVAVRGQPGGGATDSPNQQVGVAGGQLSVASATVAPTTGIAAAAPPPTPIGQGDRAILIARPAAISVAPGQPFAASFVLLNSGASTWSAAGGYSLACDHTRHPDASCPGAVAIGFGPYVIAPGQQVKFTVDLIAPSEPGVYLVWWNLAHASHIFPSPDVVLRVLVAAPPPATATLTPSATPSSSPSASPSTTPDPSPTGSPTASPTSDPSATPTLSPTFNPAPPATLPPTLPLIPVPAHPATLPPLG